MSKIKKLKLDPRGTVPGTLVGRKWYLRNATISTFFANLKTNLIFKPVASNNTCELYNMMSVDDDGNLEYEGIKMWIDGEFFQVDGLYVDLAALQCKDEALRTLIHLSAQGGKLSRDSFGTAV